MPMTIRNLAFVLDTYGVDLSISSKNSLFRCDTFGTVDNRGCDEITGECTCKRYVEGRNCDRCRPEFYGLSNDQDGCKACDCYPGGEIFPSFRSYVKLLTATG